MLKVGRGVRDTDKSSVRPSPKVSKGCISMIALKAVKLLEEEDVWLNQSLPTNVVNDTKNVVGIEGNFPWVPTIVMKDRLNKGMHRESKAYLGDPDAPGGRLCKSSLTIGKMISKSGGIWKVSCTPWTTL